MQRFSTQSMQVPNGTFLQTGFIHAPNFGFFREAFILDTKLTSKIIIDYK